MSTTRSDGGPGSGRHGDGAQPPHPTETPHPPQVTEADLEAMSQEQLARLAANLDDVEVVHNANPWPIPGTRAEKRAERAVALWFLISALCGLAFLAGVPVLAVRVPGSRRPRLRDATPSTRR